jgi:integrase
MARKRRGRTEGSIYCREADNQWVGIISLGYRADGRRKRRAVYAPTKQEVQAKMHKLQTKALAGALPETGRLTVAEYLNRWLENTAKNRVRQSTFARYEVYVRLHLIPTVGGVQLSRVRALHVESCYAEMERNGASAWTRKMAGMLLTAALRHAVRLKLIPFNPAADVAKARPEEKEMCYLTDAQVKQFLKAAQGVRLYALFVLAVGSGMRQGEMLALQWGDIDFERGTVAVQRSLSQVKGQFMLKEPKSKRSRRTIQLPRFVLQALEQHRQAMLKEGNITGPVFCTRTGQFITKSNLIRQVFKLIIPRANAAAVKEVAKRGQEPALLPLIRFHDLRHTHATSLLAQGNSIKAVSQRLGHANIELTLRVYAHVLPTDDGDLAKGLDRVFG